MLSHGLFPCPLNRRSYSGCRIWFGLVSGLIKAPIISEFPETSAVGSRLCCCEIPNGGFKQRYRRATQSCSRPGGISWRERGVCVCVLSLIRPSKLQPLEKFSPTEQNLLKWAWIWAFCINASFSDHPLWDCFCLSLTFVSFWHSLSPLSAQMLPSRVRSEALAQGKAFKNIPKMRNARARNLLYCLSYLKNFLKKSKMSNPFD